MVIDVTPLANVNVAVPVPSVTFEPRVDAMPVVELYWTLLPSATEVALIVPPLPLTSIWSWKPDVISPSISMTPKFSP